MYKVISLKPKKNKYIVIIKDEENRDIEYTVSEDLVVEYRLVQDKELAKADYKAFIVAANRDKLYQKLLYYATFKPRTVKEVSGYLDKKEVFGNNQNYFIDRLKKVSILNDELYAKNYVYEAFNYKLYGLRKISQDLRLKGINLETIEKYLFEIKHEDIIKNIETLFFKKLNDYKKESLKKAITSLKRFLIGKGYEFSDIDSVINNNFDRIKGSIKDSENILKDFEQVKKEYDRKNPKQDRFSYIVRKLMAKGYEYHDIKALIREE